jgi:fermentation-respiration switch protein FrsA (DUF1100 family)
MALVSVMFRSLVSLILCLSLCACTGVFFQPMKTLVRTPDDIHLKYEDVHFSNQQDATQLHGWFLPAQGDVKGTILFLHGNAENISTHIGSVYWLPAEGYNVFLFDYRGYGQSQGHATIPGAISDTTSALHWLQTNPRIDADKIVVLGQSLGGALATYALGTAEYADKIKGLIIDSTFSSYQRIAREKFAAFWLTWPFQYPLAWSVESGYDPISRIANFSPTPVLIIHSRHDQIIPLAHAERLFAAAGSPKDLWIAPKGGHISALSYPIIRERLLHYLSKILSVSTPGDTT